MRAKAILAIMILATCISVTEAAGKKSKVAAPKKNILVEVAQSKRQWTGVAVSKEGRIFVNYPRWSNDVPVSVAELKGNQVIPYPDGSWNQWKAGQYPKKQWVCVQSVYVDGKNNLWVLDPASPHMKGVVADGPKLVKFDLNTNMPMQTYSFDRTVAPEKSYLNDVRIDLQHNIAYITDSGLGAIVVLNLADGTARRLLADHPSTKAEDTKIVINGQTWERDGKNPKINSDGIALDPRNQTLYYQALTGRTLYSVPVAALLDKKLTPEQLGQKVTKVTPNVVVDGIEFGVDGKLYLSSIEDYSIKRLALPSKRIEGVMNDARLVWPDSFARGSGSSMYVTTSQIHLGPNPASPYRVFKFTAK
jgi:sugar lactone lactonase YvrE